MAKSAWVIDLDETGHKSKVFLNGQDISNQIVALEIKSSVSAPTEVKATFIAASIKGIAIGEKS